MSKNLEIDPDNSSALDAKGFILYNLGKYEEALKYYDKAIENNPNDADFYNRRSLVLSKLGKGEEIFFH